MSEENTLKMKFKLQELEFEIEGNESTVKEQFDGFKSFILKDLLPNINLQSNSNHSGKNGIAPILLEEGELDNSTQLPESQVPVLKQVVLMNLPGSEPNWIVVYSYYLTMEGKERFTEEDIKNQYTQSGRLTRSRSKNFKANLTSVIDKKHIRILNDTEYTLTKEGKEYALVILSSEGDIIKGKKSSKKLGRQKSKTNSPTGAMRLDNTLDLNPEGKESFSDYFSKCTTTNMGEKILLAIHYLKNTLGLEKVGINQIYTALDNIDVSIPKSFPQIVRNTRGEGFLDYSDMNDDISITVLGRNELKKTIKK